MLRCRVRAWLGGKSADKEKCPTGCADDTRGIIDGDELQLEDEGLTDDGGAIELAP